MIFCNHQKQYVPNHPENNSNDWDSALLSNNKDNNKDNNNINPVRQCINRFTISWLDTVTRISAVVSMCASTVGSLSSGGSIGWTLATTVGVGTAFLANTASVKRNFEEARNELHGIGEKMENGFAEARNERHAIVERIERIEKMKKGTAEAMEKGSAEAKLFYSRSQLSMKQNTLFTIQNQLRFEKNALKSATPAEKIEITNEINDLEEKKSRLKRQIEQMETLASGQEWQGSGSANFTPASPTS
eukprot:scaffold4382_cov83-Cylindrotheca_fusiformis.AAC.1